MIKNYLKIAIRNLVRHRLYSLISIVGLSVGVACCILIMLFVENDLSFDHFLKNVDSKYAVLIRTRQPGGGSILAAATPPALAKDLQSMLPQILYTTSFRRRIATIQYKDKVFEEVPFIADSNIFSMFDISFVEGSPVNAFKSPNDIVLTEETAKKYFGDEDPLGKRLRVKINTSTDATDYSVVGVVHAMPSNSSFQFDVLISSSPFVDQDAEKRANWVSTFILLQPGTNMQNLQQQLSAFVENRMGLFRDYYRGLRTWPGAHSLAKEAGSFQIELERMRDVHFDANVQLDGMNRTDSTFDYILSGIALLVLLIACINFTTIAIGRSANRSKEVGIRKVLGAARGQLMNQFFGETLLMSVFAFLLSLVIVEIMLPTFNGLMGTSLILSLIYNGKFLIVLVLLFLFVGVMAGGLPAMLISRYQPAKVLKGITKVGRSNLLTQALVVFQFGLSIFLIITAIGMSKQMNFLLNADLGFNPKQLLAIQTFARPDYDLARRIVKRFRMLVSTNPHILSVSGTNQAPTRGYDKRFFQFDGKIESTYILGGDEDYLRTMGVTLVEGRNFRNGITEDADHSIIVNEAFVHQLGWKEPIIGRRLVNVNEDGLEGSIVIGVVKDFHILSLHDPIMPVVISESPHWRLDCMLVRITPTDVPATLSFLEKKWKIVAPDKPFDYQPLDENFVNVFYASDLHWKFIVEFSSIIAILLACAGLFGLASLTLANRTKEVGVRKVLGASDRKIASLLSKEFLKLVVISNIIAWPAAYFSLNTWLNDFASRIQLSPELFLFAGGLSVAAAFLTISMHVIRAAHTNPVEALRYE